MNNVNPANIKKSALLFFIASAMFTASFTLSVLSDTPNYFMAIPAFFTFSTGVVQWVNYKKLKQKSGK